MKITMLGVSGSGKTTYMCGLLERLLENRSHNYRIMPINKDISFPDRANLIEVGKLMQLTYTSLNNRFPKGTNATTVWNFEVYKKNKFITTFEWIDYRGGLIDHLLLNEGTAVQEDIDDLLDHIEESHSVLFFADGIVLADPKLTINQKKKRLGASILNILFRRIASDNFDKELGIVLLITKADSDLIGQDYKDNNFDKLRKTAAQVFKEISYLCEDSEGRWIGKIGVVGSVGMGKVNSDIKDGTIITDIIDDPDPFNVEYPLFLLMQSAYDRSMDALIQNIKKLEGSPRYEDQQEMYHLRKQYNEMLEDRNDLLRTHLKHLFEL